MVLGIIMRVFFTLWEQRRSVKPMNRTSHQPTDFVAIAMPEEGKTRRNDSVSAWIPEEPTQTAPDVVIYKTEPPHEEEVEEVAHFVTSPSTAHTTHGVWSSYEDGMPPVDS